MLFLCKSGITTLVGALGVVMHCEGIQVWNSTKVLGMWPRFTVEWTHYIDSLKHIAIYLSERDDELC